ncbi:SGNH/GDSL hydrolase family protein [Microbacterium sp. CIAB417]|uniref:SGNH/GDSL hydrolase family protein n=1 Tax=Microbacterium sp. CIAB417 TaxID=2860287 RepID=UPI0027E27D66|nr:SGNH/GDSL hydrolase family protein [Microbacterium sp. CIAB417]
MARVRILGAVLAACVLAALGIRILLSRQAAIARRRIGKPLGEESLDADRVWRKTLEGRPVDLLLLGDSLAAGLGAERRKQTLGGRLAKAVARRLQRPVRLRTAAVVGSESSALEAQLDGLDPDYRADVAVIVVGGNDVTHLVPASVASAQLEQAVLRLQDAGTPVVVGTCPDLGTLRPVPQPLRSLLSRMSRRLALEQTRVAWRTGAVPVDLRQLVGPTFHAEPEEMFSLDRFHPSAAGYRRTAEALLPAVVTALRSRQ